MASNKIRYQGITATEKYLSVHFTYGDRAATRFETVKVPLKHLLHQDVTDALDTAIRRQLIEIWSGVDIADPLF